MTLQEIRDMLSQPDVPEETLAALGKDHREGAGKLLRSYFRKIERDNAERLRVESMYELESTFYRKGMQLVAGVDEVGRGPLAGPVTVAAVILKPHWFAAGLNDSKKVTPKHREELARRIREEAAAFSIVSVPPEEIDEINIYQATLLAMYQALKTLSVPPEAVIVDAMPLHGRVPVMSVVHGDARSASVAAASIVAKVHRDRLIEEYDRQYPGYGFAGHKGYGTARHIEAIRELGITPIHRKSFEPVRSMIENR